MAYTLKHGKLCKDGASTLDHRTPPDSNAAVGRLSFRVEGQGKNWCAYWCPRMDSMDGAVFIAAINMRMLDQRPERRDQFIAFIREIFADKVESIAGTRPTWPTPPVKAPEHERNAPS